MLFLFNDRVLDIGAPEAIAPPLRTSPQHALALAVQASREAIFAAGDIAGMHGDLLRKLAAQIAISSDANAILLVCPPRARAPAQVGVRLAEVSLTTIAFLHQRQAGRSALDPALVNQTVWMVAAPAGKA
jgi:hypothetical protein